ncbi:MULTISPECIES: DUF1488 domain-containing protein [Mesorhizobium]|uniref:DUF1488 domain-containing protein n=1 Tax=Mesorhizobium shonense TaxID=1209948 RepID=A0ABV2HX58_9HYPH|nr:MULTISPECIES: DUF1488 domain-containing protein [unclassified Mesorhizobium]AZO28401.1 DUF1488 domain-containing protein [Mesorhizobium sp. M1B.F.Ca.ET.045.04.1.1]RWA66156.1 MAG: DUF1488 family protein [Mesorhizobium sp.]RWA81760.1 MAG: DUF1488 family protein [Mesorhizobium sp.]RWB14345.1 MAG: DUF1488 family protein [Mesorhizobium sp.]TIS45570.1 MAG: DUF1488 domain-containing protein [Mesorhizobium sp.]
MTLAFPNPSRSFDEARNAVCFIGHDGMFQIRFFIEVEALAKSGVALGGKVSTETACLSAFDALRTSIQDVAGKVYARSRRDSYILTAADFP